MEKKCSKCGDMMTEIKGSYNCINPNCGKPKVSLLVTCKICKKEFPIDAYHEDLHKWNSGTLAQIAFPYLTRAERELLISQTCGKCWNEIFPEDENEHGSKYFGDPSDYGDN